MHLWTIHQFAVWSLDFHLVIQFLGNLQCQLSVSFHMEKWDGNSFRRLALHHAAPLDEFLSLVLTEGWHCKTKLLQLKDEGLNCKLVYCSTMYKAFYHVISYMMVLVTFFQLLQTFVHFMKGRCPQTILTDLDPGLRDAIRSELPNSKHVISVWNLLPKVSCWFSLPLEPRYAEFKSEFDAVCHLESTEDFEFQWNQMVSRFGLSSDKHIALLYSLRASWAFAYTRGCFLARMATSSYSKSVDAFLKGIFNAQTCLRSFFEQVR